MSAHRGNYDCWFKAVVRSLYADGNAGFAILMITFPLLERYLREKSGVHEGNLDARFYDKFLEVFPVLTTRQQAKNFWQVYRNGLLHQVTLSRVTKSGFAMPPAGLSADAPALHLDPSGSYWVDPRKFSEQVFTTIDADFTTFEGIGSVNHPMPVVYLSNGTSNVPIAFNPL